MARNLKILVLAVVALAAFVGVAEAHPGHDNGGLVGGLAHPLTGLDHILAMVAVGLLAARLGGKALWLVPVAFVGMMVLGAGLRISGMALPYVEFGIAASVIVLGLAAAFEFSLPTAAAMSLAGFFALFHGQAHGSEMPLAASAINYAVGFVISTLMLHGLGMAIGLATTLATGRKSGGVVRIVGAAMAVAGLGMLGGVI